MRKLNLALALNTGEKDGKIQAPKVQMEKGIECKTLS